MTQDFNGFGLPDKLLQSLARLKFTTPTPIQAQALPVALEGRDILGSAQTGTGKTGAFGIPLLTRLLNHPREGALVLTPTRELACQVMNALQQMIPVKEIRTAILIGGEPISLQLRQLATSPRLIVATPGRLNDHLERGSVKLNNMHCLVLDETDRMLDMGFGPQLERIVRFLPAERQTMMFSATVSPIIEKLSSAYLKNPVRIAVGSTTAPITKIRQEIIHTSEGEKYDKLLGQLGQREGSVIIFVKTKHGTERLADKLNRSKMTAEAMHGDLQQRKRERVLRGFRKEEYRILVATDVAARGLDIPHIAHVINYDLPQCPEDYIHRIGRTARAGAEGQALNLLTPADNGKWKAIHRLINGESAHEPASAPRRGAPQKGRRFEGGRPFAGGASSDRRGPSNSGWRPRGEAGAEGSSHRRGPSSWLSREESGSEHASNRRGPSSDRPREESERQTPFHKKTSSSWRPREEAGAQSDDRRGPSSWRARDAQATPKSSERRGPYKERPQGADARGENAQKRGPFKPFKDRDGFGGGAPQKRAPSKWGPKGAAPDRAKSSYAPKRPRPEAA